MANKAPANKVTSRSQAVTLGFFAVLLIGLGCVFDTRCMDITLIPRLGFLYIVLLVGLVAVALWKGSWSLEFSVLRSGLVFFFAAYLLTSWASLFFALNFTAGLTDCFKTMGGFIFFGAACLFLPSLQGWHQKVVKIAVCAGSVSTVIGFYQILTLLGPGLHPRAAMESIDGLMSNVNLYASFLCLLLPLCLCGIAVLGGIWRIAALMSGAGLSLLIVLLQTRAAYLGVLAGAVALSLPILAKPKLFSVSFRLRNLLLGSGLAVIVLVASFLMLGDASNPIISRARSLATGSADASIGGRLMAWSITLQMIKDHFPWGVGAGNFTVRLDEYFGGDEIDFSVVGTNWLQPHNDFLWVLVEKGALGLSAFLGIFVLAFLYAVSVFRRNPSPEQAWIAAFCLMGLSSYLVISFFDFPLERISHFIYLTLYLAVLAILRQEVLAIGKKKSSEFSLQHLLRASAGLALIPLALGLYYCHAAIQQEFYIQITRGVYSLQKWVETVKYARLAATPWRTLDPVATPVAFYEGMGLQNCGKDLEAIQTLELARKHNPNRIHIVNNLGILYAKQQNFPKAIECFSLVTKRYPDRIEGFENLAACYMDMSDFSSAVNLLQGIPQERQTPSSRSALELAKAMLENSKKNLPN